MIDSLSMAIAQQHQREVQRTVPLRRMAALAACDKVLSTSTVLLNDTLDAVLAACTRARHRAFAMIGPGSATRVDVGLNMKGVPATERLLAEKPGGMCQYKVKLAAASEVDAELIGWIRRAYDAAG